MRNIVRVIMSKPKEIWA